MIGEIGVLNVGCGDTKLSFDPNNPEERDKAKRVVREMLAKGFALMVEVEQPDGSKKYQRVKRFDPEKCEYIITDPKEVKKEERLERRESRNAHRERRIPAERAKGVAIARSAGG